MKQFLGIICAFAVFSPIVSEPGFVSVEPVFTRSNFQILQSPVPLNGPILPLSFIPIQGNNLLNRNIPTRQIFQQQRNVGFRAVTDDAVIIGDDTDDSVPVQPIDNNPAVVVDNPKPVYGPPEPQLQRIRSLNAAAALRSEYGAPVLRANVALKTEYGAPNDAVRLANAVLRSEYGAPAINLANAVLRSEYGAPALRSNVALRSEYGAPVLRSNVALRSEYGAPGLYSNVAVRSEYGAPVLRSNVALRSEYGAPGLYSNVAVRSEYGAPGVRVANAAINAANSVLRSEYGAPQEVVLSQPVVAFRTQPTRLQPVVPLTNRLVNRNILRSQLRSLHGRSGYVHQPQTFFRNTPQNVDFEIQRAPLIQFYNLESTVRKL